MEHVLSTEDPETDPLFGEVLRVVQSHGICSIPEEDLCAVYCHLWFNEMLLHTSQLA